MNPKELAKTACHALEEKKGINITVIDISKVSVMADYFIIAGGNNENQVHALADSVEEELLKAGVSKRHLEGYDNANWILMDFQDVIVHIFNEEDRAFYTLERIWSDGAVVDVNDL